MAFTKINAAGIGSTETVTLDGLTVINDGSFGGNVSVGGTLTYEDVTNIDSVGLITARAGVVVGSGITLSKDGDVFFTGIATGNGSGLTALNASNISSGTVPTARLGSGTASSSTFLAGDSTFKTVTGTTINTNADNRIITGSGTANTLNGESNFTFDGTSFTVGASGNSWNTITRGDLTHYSGFHFNDSGSTRAYLGVSGATNHIITGSAQHDVALRSESNLLFAAGGASERLRIGSDGAILVSNSTGIGIGAATNGSSSYPSVTISGTSGGAIHFEDDGDLLADIYGSSSGLSLSTRKTSDNIVFQTNSGTVTEKVRIAAGGNVYIGQTSGSEQLGVDGGSNAQTFSTNSTNSNGNMLQVKCSGTTKLFLGSAGSFITGNTGTTNQGIRAEGALLFATGGHTERVRITSDGYMTRPNHPNFCARHTGSSVAYSAGDIVKYNTVSENYRRWNIGGHYSTSTGKFTVPVDGIYYFEAQVMTIGWNNGDFVQDLIYLNSSQGNVSFPRQRRSYFTTDQEANGYLTQSVAGQANLAANQTVWIVIQRACSVSSESFSYFTGWLVQ